MRWLVTISRQKPTSEDLHGRRVQGEIEHLVTDYEVFVFPSLEPLLGLDFDDLTDEQKAIAVAEAHLRLDVTLEPPGTSYIESARRG